MRHALPRRAAGRRLARGALRRALFRVGFRCGRSAASASKAAPSRPRTRACSTRSPRWSPATPARSGVRGGLAARARRRARVEGEGRRALVGRREVRAGHWVWTCSRASWRRLVFPTRASTWSTWAMCSSTCRIAAPRSWRCGASSHPAASSTCAVRSRLIRWRDLWRSASMGRWGGRSCCASPVSPMGVHPALARAAGESLGVRGGAAPSDQDPPRRLPQRPAWLAARDDGRDRRREPADHRRMQRPR